MLRERFFLSRCRSIKQVEPTQGSYIMCFSGPCFILSLVTYHQLDTCWLQYKLYSSMNQTNSNQAEKKKMANFVMGLVTWIKIDNFDFKKFLWLGTVLSSVSSPLTCSLSDLILSSSPPSAGRQADAPTFSTSCWEKHYQPDFALLLKEKAFPFPLKTDDEVIVIF